MTGWTNDVRDVAYGDRASAPLNAVHGFSNSVPARLAGHSYT